MVLGPKLQPTLSSGHVLLPSGIVTNAIYPSHADNLECYIGYLTTLCETQFRGVKRYDGWSVMNRKMRKYPGICIEMLRKIAKTSER